MYQQQRAHHGKTQMEDFMNPMGASARQTDKNFHKSNMQNIKQKEQDFRQRNEPAEQQQPFKMQKFKNVEPRVQVPKAQNGLAGLPKPVLNDVEEDDMETNTAYRNQDEFMQDRCDDFPEFEEEYQDMMHEYEQENQQDNFQQQPVQQKQPVQNFQRGPQKQEQQDYSGNFAADMQKHKQYGKTPGYIQQYKQEAQDKEAQRQAEREKAKLPPGTRLMPEKERLETLQMLEQTHREVQNMIERLPLSAQSVVAQKKRRELETKMNDLERQITMFKREKVFVAE